MDLCESTTGAINNYLRLREMNTYEFFVAESNAELLMTVTTTMTKQRLP